MLDHLSLISKTIVLFIRTLFITINQIVTTNFVMQFMIPMCIVGVYYDFTVLHCCQPKSEDFYCRIRNRRFAD